MATGTPKRVKSKWPIAALGVALGAVIGGVVVLTPAFAVHEAPYTNFELDGNPTDSLFPTSVMTQ